MAHDVFISYSTADKTVAEAVRAALESKNIQCWIAPRDIPAGVTWVDAIVDAIDGCRLFILVSSANSNSSTQVLSELQRVASKSLPIIPLRIDNAPLTKAVEFYTSRYQWLDAQVPPLERHLVQLAETVQQLLARDDVARARKAAEAAAKEKARLEAEAAQERASKEAEEAKKAQELEEKSKKEAEQAAREKAQLEAEAAQERARKEAEDARKAKEAENRARKEAEEKAAKEKERLEAEAAQERARKEAEDAREAKEAEDRARKGAEEKAAKEKERLEAKAALEKAKQEAEDAKKAQELEEKAKEEAEQAAKEKARLEAKSAKEKARKEAEEARKAREAREKARKEAEKLAKEKARLEAKEAAELAKQQAEITPKEAERGAQKLIKSTWFWAGVSLLVIGFTFMIILPLVNIQKSSETVEGLRAGLGIMLIPGVIPTALGTFSLCRSLVKRQVRKPVWLRVGDIFFIVSMVLPFPLMIIMGSATVRLYGTSEILPELTLSLPVMVGAVLAFLTPAIFCLRRGLTQELQPQVVKITQTRGFWIRLALLSISLMIPIVFTILISLNADPTEGQKVGLGMMLVYDFLVVLAVYYFWRGLVKNRLSKRSYLRLVVVFLSLAVVLPFALIGILLSGTPGTAPMWDMILPAVLLVSLPLVVIGIYYLRQGTIGSKLWIWSGSTVLGILAGGIIALVFIFRPTNLPPQTDLNTTSPESAQTISLLPAELIWKISLPFDQNFIETGPIMDWAEDIKNTSNGRWRIEIYYKEQLATKDKTLDGIKNRLFEGALISSQFSSDDTPLMTVLQNPFLSPSDITQQGEWLMAVAQHPAIVEELSRWNTQILFPVCSPPYNFMGNILLQTADDFIGRKINCYNRGVQALAEFGALPYSIQVHLLHSALEDGTVDSVSRPWSIAFVANKLYEVSKYATIDIDFIIEDMFIVISMDAWKELPDEWKKLCQDAAQKAIARYAKVYAEADLTFIPIFKEAGIEIINFPEVEKTKLVAKAEGVWEKWVEEMEAKGLPGREVFEFAKAKSYGIMEGTTQ